MSQDNTVHWRIIDEKKVFDATPWFQVYKQHIEKPSGFVIPDFYKIDVPDTVVVVPVGKFERILTIQQYRPGIRTVTWGVPAGFVEENETPLECAMRELEEETGYKCKSLVKLGNFTKDLNRGLGVVHFYLALDLIRSNTDFIRDDEGILQIDFVSIDDLREMLKLNKIEGISFNLAIWLALSFIKNKEACNDHQQNTL